MAARRPTTTVQRDYDGSVEDINSLPPGDDQKLDANEVNDTTEVLVDHADILDSMAYLKDNISVTDTVDIDEIITKLETIEEGATADDSTYAAADTFGIVPNSLDQQGALIQSYIDIAGADGVISLRPGAYVLGQGLHTGGAGQTWNIDGVTIDDYIAFEHGFQTFNGTLVIDGQNRADGGPWFATVWRYSKNSNVNITVRNIKGSQAIFGGCFRAQMVNSNNISIYGQDIGMAAGFSIGDGGLICYSLSSRSDDIGTITSGGTGYRDGSYIAYTSTLTGSGSDAILGIVVESGVVTEVQPLFGGQNYSTGDTLSLGASAHCYSYDRTTMNSTWDTLFASYKVTKDAGAYDRSDAGVIAAKALLDAEENNVIGSGFVYTVGDTQENNLSWFNNNNIYIGSDRCSGAGIHSLGKCNYNNFQVFLEGCYTGHRPHMVYTSNDSNLNLNILVNKGGDYVLYEDVLTVDLSSSTGHSIGGTRIGNPYVTTSYDGDYPGWHDAVIDLGDYRSSNVTVFCDDANTRFFTRSPDTRFAQLTFESDLNNPIAQYLSTGRFTPTAVFSANGDNSVVYTNQTGIYQRFGNKIDFWITIEFTPTYTTSTGTLRVMGLPFTTTVKDDNNLDYNWPVAAGNITNVNSPSDVLGVTGHIWGDYISFQHSRDNAALNTVDATEVASGVATIIEAHGSYLI